jgi:hypothetical protein
MQSGLLKNIGQHSMAGIPLGAACGLLEIVCSAPSLSGLPDLHAFA